MPREANSPGWGLKYLKNKEREPLMVPKKCSMTGRTVIRRVIVTALAAVLLIAPATAQELTGTLKKIKDSGTITLGHRESSIPFSYYDDKQQVVGYSHDLMLKAVDAGKKKLNLDSIEVRLNPVTSATRIPLMANGTIDLECGSTTNNLE